MTPPHPPDRRADGTLPARSPTAPSVPWSSPAR
jgi:hypothetical protein